MRILKYKGKLVEEVGYSTSNKVVFLRYVRPEDMPKCECGRPIDKEISIVEGCLNWEKNVSGVYTIPPLKTKETPPDYTKSGLWED